jgi:hypothetical protein
MEVRLRLFGCNIGADCAVGSSETNLRGASTTVAATNPCGGFVVLNPPTLKTMTLGDGGDGSRLGAL